MMLFREENKNPSDVTIDQGSDHSSSDNSIPIQRRAARKLTHRSKSKCLPKQQPLDDNFSVLSSTSGNHKNKYDGLKPTLFSKKLPPVAKSNFSGLMKSDRDQ